MILTHQVQFGFIPGASVPSAPSPTNFGGMSTFGPYWAFSGASVDGAPAPTPTVRDLGVRRRRWRKHEIEREKRIVEEYLEALATQEAAIERAKLLPKKKRVAAIREIERKAPSLPDIIREQMASVSFDNREARVAAEREAAERVLFKRRYWASFMTLALMYYYDN